MMFRGLCNIDMKFFRLNSGIILIDIILALTLATIFIAVMTTESMSARILFDHTHDRKISLESFESNQDIEWGNSRPFGNDLIQHDSFGFTKVSLPNGTNFNENITTPLCSVDFLNHQIVGSYGFGTTSKVKIVPISLPINSSLPLTDFQIRDGVAYVSTDSSVASDPDLLVIDFKDINNPKLLSSINTGPGISSISLADNYIYAAVPSTAGQLQIIRLEHQNSTDNSGPTRLVLESKFKIPLPLASTTPTKASSVFYYKDRIYLGTEKWDGDELSVIDITNTSNPLKIGGFETDGKIKDIFINKDVAYIAGADLQQLRILNVSNPASPFLINSFSPSGSTRQEGNTVSTFEGSLNFGRTSGGFNIAADPEFFGFNLASSSNLGQFSSYDSLDIPGGVYGIVEDRSHIFLATRQLNKEFQIYDISTSTFLATSTATLYSLPVAPQKMTCDGDHLYILSATAPVIYEISFN